MLDMLDSVAPEKNIKTTNRQNIHGTILASGTNIRFSETEIK